jgi:outer membrane receptor for ferrienterochelin and colicins
LADDLKEESSHSFSFSADWYPTIGKTKANIMLELFSTQLKDVFTIRMLEEFDNKGNQVQERYNGSGATVYGANIEGKAVFSQSLMLQGGLTWQKSRYKEPEHWSENPEVAPEKKCSVLPTFMDILQCNILPTKNLPHH